MSLDPMSSDERSQISMPVVFMATGTAHPSSVLEAFGTRLAADGYRAVVLSGRTSTEEMTSGGSAYGVITFGDDDPLALKLVADNACKVLVRYDPSALAPAPSHECRWTVLHVGGQGVLSGASGSRFRIYSYPGSQAGFALESSPNYEPFAAGVAYSRTLESLKRVLGPHPDLGGLFREHLRLEFEARDADATMKTMVDEPYVNHVPTMTGGTGHDQLKRFYKYHFIPSTPKNRKTVILNEIVGSDAVVIEAINCFTHSEPYDHFLPGVPPTGKYVEVPFVAIARFRGEKLYCEHIYWDQSSVLVQLGLIERDGLPVSGREQADKVRDPRRPSNELMTRWRDSEGKPL